MMKGIAVQHARHGIRSQLRAAGVDRDRDDRAGDGLGPFRRQRAAAGARSAAGARGDDFAGIAVYFASDGSRYHTGDVVTIDGGYHSF